MTRIEKFVFEHNMLYQVLADSLFWESVPEFTYLKDEGEAAHFFALERLLKPREVVPGCVGCTSLRTTMRPILDTMVADIARWVEEDPTKLDNLVAYITKRRGFRPHPIVVYHKDEQGKIRAIEF
jgi:hypothetical protein